MRRKRLKVQKTELPSEKSGPLSLNEPLKMETFKSKSTPEDGD